MRCVKAGFFLFLSLFSGLNVPCYAAEDPPVSAEEERERITAERFLEVLLRRPNKGTALDRVFGFHIGRGDIDQVIDRLTSEAQRTEDADAAGRHWMVVGLLQLQRSEDAAAIGALAKAESQLPQNALAAYYHGQALLMVGQTDEAANAMQRAIDLKPTRQDYMKMAGQLGRLYQRAGKVDQALQIWEQLETSFPGDDGVRQQIARIMIEEGDVAGALARYDTLSKEARSPNDKIVFAMRAADLRSRMGDKDVAVKQFEGLLAKLRPGSYLHEEARRRIETIFLASGDYAGLAEYYEKWVGNHPDDVGAVVRLARTLAVQGRGPEALLWFQKAIEKAPSDTAPRVALINAYIAQGKFSDAAAQYQALVEIEPGNPDHLVRWGKVLIEDEQQSKQDRSKAAAEVWTRLAKLRSDDAVVQSQVADLFRGAELVDEAIAQYRNAIRLAPDQPQYKEYLGEYLHRIDRKDEAIAVWRSLVEGDLRTRKNLVRLAEVLHQFERGEEALSTMGEACDMDPTIEERLRYGEWLRDEGQYEPALAQFALAGEMAENFDERERVFAAELKTYQASGQLDQRIEKAIVDAESKTTDSDLWRQLAVLYNARGKKPEALKAIETALEHAPTSIESLAIAARMYEESGRLRLAVEKRRLLAETDSRFRTGHLQKLSSLYLRVGETEQAVSVGKELLAASAGSIDAYRFYADLCGKIGRIDQRLDTLRRCARLNPRSNEAQRMLASQLSEDFKTDQAIELYWKMLDGADDLDERRTIVGTLAELYLRTNRLDQLISRLEIRGRESGDRRTTIDLVATAHQQAGDLGLARQVLEGLLREGGRDTMLLERLVTLAEQSGEYDEAVSLQRQLARLAPDRKNEARLASLLIDIGEMDEAQALWLRLTETSTDGTEIARNVNRLFAAGEVESAVKLVSQSLQRDPDNWESRLQQMVLHADQGDWEQAAKAAELLMSIKLDDATPPAGSKPYESTVITNSRQSYSLPPVRLARIQNMYSFYRIVDERYGSQSNPTLPKPIDFGHAKLMATYCQLKQRKDSGQSIKSHLSELEKSAMHEQATAEQVWKWYETAELAASVEQTSTVNPQNPDHWGPLWRLAEIDHDSGRMLLISMFVNRTSYAQRGDIELQKLSDDRMQWLKERAESPHDPLLDMYGRNASWAQMYGSELRIAGQAEEANDYFQMMLAQSLAEPNATQTSSVLQQVVAFGTDDQFWQLVEHAMSDKNATSQNAGVSMSSQLLMGFSATKRIDDKLSKGPTDSGYRARIMELFDHVLQDEVDKPLQRQTIRLTGIGGARTFGRVVSGNYSRTPIDFPPTGLGPDDSFVFTQYSAWERMKGHADEWIRTLQSEAIDPTNIRLRIRRKLAAATILQWEKRTAEALEELNEATDLAAQELPQLEPELRLMSADLLLRQGRKREALEAIDSLAVDDQRTMAVREFAAARLAAAIGDRERARSAAKRLYGVRLNTEAQIELAKLMRKLDMRQLASDLVRRMRSQGGSTTDQLQSLMTYFVAQGEKEQAAEVATELLRRSAPSRRATSQYTTTSQIRRRNALQTLATTGRLASLIKATEGKLEKAPKSQRIRSELAEMYVAAGQPAKSQALLGESDLKDVNSTRALEATAEQLVAAGKMDEACDAYLKLLRRKQDTFSQKFYDIKRPFDAKQRLGDLADVMIQVGLQKFTDHRVSELCGDMLRNDGDVAKARALYSAMLDRPPTTTNSMYSMSNMMGSARKLLTDQEIVMRTANYLIDASVGGTPWNTLFNGYSTSSDGRHNNVTTYFVRHIAADSANADAVISKIRETLANNEDWIEGKIWLGLLLASQEKYEEAIELLQPLVGRELSPVPTHDSLWLVGSLIDSHKPMQKLAEQVYDRALNETTDRSNRDFKYSLKGRVCNFMADIGNNERARQMALESIANAEEQPSTNSGNAEYEAYQKIQSTMSMMEFLAKIEFPSDALRIAREFDKSLFAKAGRYQSGREEQFEKTQQDLLDQVRDLGGLEVVKSMISQTTEKPAAVDFGISLGGRPFTDEGLSSLWVEMLEQAGEQESNAKEMESLLEQLASLHDDRPNDDSATVAYSIAADIVGDRQPLQDLVTGWTVILSDDAKVEDQRARRRLLMIALLRLDRSARGDSATSERQTIADLKIESLDGFSPVDATYFLAALGGQSLKRGDVESARSMWRRAVDLNANQWLLLDLSHAAIESAMPQISADAFKVAVSAPSGQIAEQNDTAVSAGSLGQLLSSAQPRQNTSSSATTQTLDQEEVRLARRILELDEAWRVHKLYTKFVFDPLIALTLKSDGNHPRTLCVPAEIKPNDRIVIQSVFDRLARRASWSKSTDKLLSYLTADDAETHLLAGIVLLNANRGEEALKHFEAIDPSALTSIPNELVMQSLLLAFKDSSCREQGVTLGLALVDQNRPTQRYGNVQPFDTFSLELAKVGLNMDANHEYVAEAINKYLELTAHDNDRYSGISSQLTRRISQLEKVAQLLLPKGRVDEALRYLAMRQSAFAQGFDRNNDWVGSWALESIQGMSDRKSAYLKLADWTFEGDGPLNGIRTLVRRQRLPNWFSAGVGGSYPPFPPVADPTLPIASNEYMLVKLAQQTDSTDDLMERLVKAQASGRAGADTALAICLASMNQTVEPELIQKIQRRLESIRPGDGKPASAAPLVEMQLASILADSPAHQPFVKNITTELLKHTHSQSRGYLNPWIAKYQHAHGWSETSSWKSADELNHWMRSTMASGKDYSEGKTVPIWVTDQKSRIDHVGGFSDDYLWFRYPLTGNFRFEIETQDGGWSESELVIDGLRFTALGNSSNVYLKTQSTSDWVRIPTKVAKKNDWNRCSVTLDKDFLSYHLNDTLIYREARKDRPTWIGLHSEGAKKTSVRNIKISGEPTIPDSVDLIPEGSLRGWSGQYYGATLPTAGVNTTKREQDAGSLQRYRSSPKPNQIDNLAWTVKDGELISGRVQKQSFNGQNSIRYERPIGDGETLSYEFFYQEGKTEAHPSIGRTAYILRPSGVALHWMSAPNTPWGIPKGYEVPLPGVEEKPLPLKSGEWNQVELERTGRKLRILLNGQVVFDQEPQSRLGDMVFGFFHNREQTSARLRNVTLRGSWPESVPDELLSF